MPDRLDSLKPLRTWRVRPERDTSIGAQVTAIVRQIAASHRQSGAAVAAWEAAAPQALLKCCEVRGTNAGVLTIRAANSATRYQLDRWLQSGGEAALRSGGVAKVRVV